MRTSRTGSRAARMAVVGLTALTLAVGTAACVDVEEGDDEVEQEQESDEDD